MKKPLSTLVAVAMASLVWTAPAFATFHLWDISEVYSNADGTVQFIELFTTANTQQFTAGHTIRTSQGVNSHEFVFPSNAPSPTGGHHLLLATTGFAKLPGSVAPDFTLDDGFLFTLDGVVDFVIANKLTYECLPLDGVMSLHCDTNDGIRCTTTSVTVNSPTNYAGITGSIDSSIGGCLDTDNDGLCDVCDPCAGGPTSGDPDANASLDLNDWIVLESCLLGPGGGDPVGCECFDFDTDNDTDLRDFAIFQSVFLEP